MAADLADSRLGRLRDAFGVEFVETEPIVGGRSGSLVWRARGDDGGWWCLKRASKSARFGLALASSIARRGGPGVAAPRLSVGGEPWLETAGKIWSVTPWIDGVDAVTEGMDDRQWTAFGATLRSVHDGAVGMGAVGLGAVGLGAVGGEAAVAPSRRGIRRVGWSGARQLAVIDELLGSHPQPAREVGSASDSSDLVPLWEQHRPRLARLVEVERRLKSSRSPARRVPCHGDPHPGNIVLDADGQPWLIDFDDATIAPQEVDLHLIELGVIFPQPISETSRRAFRQGYGEVSLDEDRVIRFGCVRAIEDVTSTVRDLLSASSADEATDLRWVLDGVLGEHGLVTLVEDRLASRRSGTSIR